MPFSKYRTDYFVSILSDADKSRVAPSCGIMYVPPVLSHEPAMVVTDGVCVVEDGNTDHPKGSDSMAASSSCTQYASAFSASPSPENDDHSMNSATSVSGDLEQSQAMRLLDAELVELERLILLQRRKVEGLGRLREQYLSGDRCDLSEVGI